MIQSCNLYVTSCLSEVLYQVKYTLRLVVHFKQTKHNAHVTGQDPIPIITQYKCVEQKPTGKKAIVSRKAAIIS